MLISVISPAVGKQLEISLNITDSTLNSDLNRLALTRVRVVAPIGTVAIL